MGEVRMTRDFFLWCMSVIYLFAFASLFVQIPGLYGDNGILPARLVVQQEAQSFHDLITNQPSLLRLLPKLGLDTQSGMDVLCLGGIILSFVGMISRTQRNSILFAALWVFYLSLFQVGQTFLWFQWDILLLETGFLCILVAPFNNIIKGSVWYHQHDSITLWLIKWLLFRLMFASGVVKLTSLCPTWWGLTALNYHYETQCIPTPAAWVLHQFPEWFQKLSVVAVYVIEIAVPFLFFSPVRSQRIFACYSQWFFQFLIILTGNYNFFNLLTCVLCLSLVDDNFLRKWMQKDPIETLKDPEHYPVVGKFWGPLKTGLNLVVFGAIFYWAVKLFNLRVSRKPSLHVESEIAFSENDLTRFLQKVLPLSIWIGIVSLVWEILKSLYFSVFYISGYFSKMRNIVGVMVLGVIAALMFAVSLVPHTMVEKQSYQNLWRGARDMHSFTSSYRLSSPYGLFRRMTGVGGRPEVIIEGSNDMNKGWQEYNFLYKPGNITFKLPVVAPHQPRLDWQMWFAALGSYQHNPWFLNLVYRILNNQPEVMALMGKNPFPDKPPRYIRANLYHYYFTKSDKEHEYYRPHDWWVRKKVKEYLPIITKDEPSLVNYLKQAKIITNPHPKQEVAPNFFLHIVQFVRRIVGQTEGFATIMSLFAIGLGLTFLDPTLNLVEMPSLYK